MHQSKLTRFTRMLSSVLAIGASFQPILSWYVSSFGIKDPFVPTKPADYNVPLGPEWMLPIQAFMSLQLLYAIGLIFCAWYGFNRLLDASEAVVDLKHSRNG